MRPDLLYFNSRPSARGDLRAGGRGAGHAISIHAPPRGATRRQSNSPDSSAISIHAPPRGATRWPPAQSSPSYFNSRPSARGDWKQLKQAKVASYFNSRPSARGDICYDIITSKKKEFQFTPLREGRHEGRKGNKWLTLFQFTPLREGRPKKSQKLAKKGLFQFTPLREGRLAVCPRMPLATLHFNSRPSARGDISFFLSSPSVDISIHAPPRGATIASVVRSTYCDISIHAPPRGATSHVSTSIIRSLPYFNSRPSARGDQYGWRRGQNQQDFNSRPSARGDVLRRRACKRRSISIHAPPRGAT